MAVPSPLGRFFKPASEPGKAGSPHTPLARQSLDGDLVTTPNEPPRKRAAEVLAAAPSPSPPEPKRARGDGDAPVAGSAPHEDAQPPALAPPSEPPQDLQVALQRSQHAFTAECFHYYHTGGHGYDWPTWLQPANLKDLAGRRPDQPGFEQGTLWVPDEEKQKKEGHGTPMLLQYWKMKRRNFDKVALFKVGKFYEVFYYDAFIANRVCDLKWMAAQKKPHVGFPEMAKHQYAKQLVDAGFKVVVVEQVERVTENKERTGKPMNTCIEREACEVFTKGTVVDPAMIGGSDAKFMVYVHFEDGNGAAISSGTASSAMTTFSACLVDCATSQIRVGRIPDAADRNGLRTLMAQVQPSEVVYSAAHMPADVMSILRRLPCRPQLSPTFEKVSLMQARDKLDKYRKQYPDKMSESVNGVFAHESSVMAASGAMAYLESVLLGQRILPFAVWDGLDLGLPIVASAGQATSSRDAGRRMMLDATALGALEILETTEGVYKGSLLDYLDHTCTTPGFRLLKSWVCAPLYDAGEIRVRQETVEFLACNAELAGKLRSGLKKTAATDLERATSRIWGYALQTERNAVMYEDVTAKRLGDFTGVLEAYEQNLQVLVALPSSVAGTPLPERLKQLSRTQANGGCLPDLAATITRLRGSVVSETQEKSGKLKHRPRSGVDKPYDDFTAQIDAIKASLEKVLEAFRKQFPSAGLHYVHRLPGFRYEIECDEGALPQTFMRQVDVTGQTKSGAKSKVRFQTAQIKQLLGQLDSLEDKREDCIYPFLAKLFHEFYAHQAQFRAAVRLISELDALLSLAMTSQTFSGASCRPELVAPDDSGTSVLEVRGCRHPVAASRMGTAFVPNDALMNAEGVAGVLVVTGPNMGGKSTVLRQTCLAVVLAQLGCRVNATSCRLSPVDRIFTRIGSYDTILEGKSTLYTELEETASILAYGTSRSLAVLDELGRGTSTFDGAAIAAAVLDDLAHRVKCLVLFATHYHPVSREAVRSPSIDPYHMAAEMDSKTSEMTFLYRFLPGLCPASQGHNVARLAGLPHCVLQEAKAKSDEFESGLAPDDEADGVREAQELLKALEAGDEASLRSFYQRSVASGVRAT